MADQPTPGQDRGDPRPAPQPTGAAPTGTAPNTPQGPGVPATPSPRPQLDPYPMNPAFLPGIDPNRAGGFTVRPELLLPAASRADGHADALKGLGDGLALGAPAGLAGFRTGWQAGALADEWSRELGALSQAVRACATRIRATTQAYFEAEARNAGSLR